MPIRPQRSLRAFRGPDKSQVLRVDFAKIARRRPFNHRLAMIRNAGKRTLAGENSLYLTSLLAQLMRSPCAVVSAPLDRELDRSWPVRRGPEPAPPRHRRRPSRQTLWWTQGSGQS